MAVWTTGGATAAALALIVGSTSAQEFRYRGRAADRVPCDRDNGCVAPVRSCDEAAKICVIDYADAYGNDLRVTVAIEGDPRLKRWRLNPPDAPSERAPDPADQEVPADR